MQQEYLKVVWHTSLLQALDLVARHSGTAVNGPVPKDVERAATGLGIRLTGPKGGRTRTPVLLRRIAIKVLETEGWYGDGRGPIHTGDDSQPTTGEAEPS